MKVSGSWVEIWLSRGFILGSSRCRLRQSSLACNRSLKEERHYQFTIFSQLVSPLLYVTGRVLKGTILATDSRAKRRPVMSTAPFSSYSERGSSRLID